ncbi:N(4)-acetylcytidine aminohydrolase [Marinomonas transparens]|uniref:N(4)-acetylcytidine amidohydrolase n=1 Tax=Marinomonas transparens TaxID=2795388 RepID=A0A934JMJ0_9GAMM|nr:N(4)-acetylcytidine aminohydrolase [Marinomonas transparens]MBJ7538546.1 ASCH domain-containing protein [Marinomonas transparens]
MSLSKITFFERFEADILSGKKTITIRDEAEKDYSPNSIVQVSTYEDDRWFCALKIHSVHAITFHQLSDFHAKQENMTLPELKNVIQDIYPNVDNLYVISYELVD